ncbi:DUF2637 domain-containing protein [Nocardia abscessus]|uniref:DUF2637 domain-containing protein n=1 Tax=Nocardia abscessus TaxID=120957 RepID=UPI002455F1B6|nr:DUF2637 domain-containing protein [Nocardia abscessus]
MLAPARIALAGAVALTVLSFILSFSALTDLADRAGITYPVLWPLIVDGLGIVATVAVVALRRSVYAWFLLGSATVISIIGNVVHAVLPSGPVAPEVAAAVAVVPPVAMLAVIHLAVILATAAQNPAAVDEPAPAVEATEPKPAPAVEAPPIADIVAQPEPAAAVEPAEIPAPAPAAPSVRAKARTADARVEAEALIADHPKLSNYAIAERVGVSEASVRRSRNALVTV